MGWSPAQAFDMTQLGIECSRSSSRLVSRCRGCDSCVEINFRAPPPSRDVVSVTALLDGV